jgi:hypothetical protein
MKDQDYERKRRARKYGRGLRMQQLAEVFRTKDAQPLPPIQTEPQEPGVAVIPPAWESWVKESGIPYYVVAQAPLLGMHPDPEARVLICGKERLYSKKVTREELEQMFAVVPPLPLLEPK